MNLAVKETLGQSLGNGINTFMHYWKEYLK